MNDREIRAQIHHAMDARLSGMTGNPYLAQRILAGAKGGKKVKRKLSVGLVLTFVLILVAVTALAITLLSGQELVEEVVVPMAQENDINGQHESFSGSELEAVIRTAEENDIAIEKQFELEIESGQGYSEEETIMAIARETFGGNYSEWTIEQKHWFGEMMVKIGFRKENPACLPKENELSLEQAMTIVQKKIFEDYGDDILDASRWRRVVDYETGKDEQGSQMPPIWNFNLIPMEIGYNQYRLTMDSDGNIQSFDVVAALNGNSGDAIIEQYQSIYGGFVDWNYETWASLGNALKGRWPDTRRCWAFQNAGYMLPPENGITEGQAQQIALDTIDLEYTSTKGSMCCMDGGTPIWKILTRTKTPEDSGRGKYSAVWFVEIDCMTGEVREKKEYIVGSEMDPFCQWVPWNVLQSLPPMPAGPNG